MRNTCVVLTALGGPEVQVIEDDVRDPGPNELRIQILACGVAFADVLMRRGMYSGVPPLPYSPGYDIVGTVESCGPGVSGWKPGDCAAALTQTGGYSRYIVLPESQLVRVPDGLDAAEAVSLVLNYTTAYQLIHRIARLGTGQSMLIHGAAGGVGTAALQLGSLTGLKMFGTASKAKHDLVAALGGIPIDYRTEDFVSRAAGVHAVFDPIGGRNWLRSYRALGPGGWMIGYGMSAAIEGGRRNMALAGASFALLTLLGLLPGKSARWYSIITEKKKHTEWFREDLSRLLEMLRDKSIHPVVAERLPLSGVSRAHELLEHALSQREDCPAVPGMIVEINEQRSRMESSAEECTWKKVKRYRTAVGADREQFRVTRKKGTEPAFSGEYWDTKKHGVFQCVLLRRAALRFGDQVRFGDRLAKFLSADGRVQGLAELIIRHGMARTEVMCSRCEAHRGQTFWMVRRRRAWVTASMTFRG